MKLKNIKIELENLGYKVYIKDDQLFGGVTDGWSNELECELLKSTFSIDIKNESVVLDYSSSNTINEKEFKETESVIKFIQKTFPVEH